jgi:hypothetical protein
MAEFRGTPTSLAIYLSGFFDAAIADLPLAEIGGLWKRFFSWTDGVTR